MDKMSAKWPARSDGQTPDITGCPDEPWWTRQAITWMDEHLKKDMRVFEWGAGASTPWLAARCARLTTIEHNWEYARLAAGALKEAGMDPVKYNVTFRPLGASYYQCVDGEYDAMVIDGRMRVHCCQSAIRVLKSGGILLLDNAERKEYAAARAMLSGWSVIETSNGIWQTNIWIKPNA